MAVLTLLISLVCTTLYLLGRLDKSTPYTSLRLAFLYSLLTHSVLIFLFTELTSAFNLVNADVLSILWGLENVVVIYLLFIRSNKQEVIGQIKYVARLTGLSARARIAVYAGLVVLILPLLLLAIFAPPSNYDSHTYHLNRILFWVWNGNVDHFPTIYLPQLYNNVFAEYIVLHVFLLSGSDQFVNLVQFAAMLGSVVVVSLLAKTAGASRRGQLLASLVMFSLPIGILESTTTQNDYVACFYFLCFVLFGYRLLAQRTKENVFFFTASLALGCATKYTIFFFALPFVIFFGIRYLLKYGFRPSLLLLTVNVLALTLVFSPFFLRNWQAFGELLSPAEGSALFTQKIPVDKYGLTYTLSNLTKNVGLQVGLPYEPYNRQVESIIQTLNGWLGVAMDDPGLSLDPYRTRFSMQEDMAPNTLHFALIVLTALFLFGRRGNQNLKILFGLAFAGFLLFCTAFKFQWWSTRTQMPFLALGAVVVAQMVATHVRSIWIHTFVGLLFAVSLPLIFGNSAKMVFPAKYISKQLTAHIPVAICPADTAQARLFRTVLAGYYNCDPAQSCYSIRQTFTYAERKTIFAKLDSIRYYDDEKQNTVLSSNREKAYFSNHLGDYAKFAPLLDYPVDDLKHIGVFFRESTGFYHYWSALNYRKKRPLDMAYIRYDKALGALPNAQKAFFYQYILTDDIALLQQTIPAATIASVYGPGPLKLVKLTTVSSSIYLF